MNFLGVSEKHPYKRASQMALVVKNLPANAGDVRDMDSIPVLGRSPGGGNGNSFQYSYLKIPWTEESGGLQSIGSQRVGHNLACTHHELEAVIPFNPPSSIVRQLLLLFPF